MRTWIAAVGLLLAACGGGTTTPPPSAADTATADTATADTAGADVSSGDSGSAGDGDAAGPDAAANDGTGSDGTGSDAAEGDTAGADGTVADVSDAKVGQDVGDAVVSPDLAQGDAAVPDAGPSPDTATTPDSGPKPDAGPKPDVPPGSATCETACQNIVGTGCPNEDPLDQCVAECQNAEAQAANCAKEFKDLLQCASTATLTCNAGGKTSDKACEPFEDPLSNCMKGSGDCAAGPCYMGGGPGGITSCGCEVACKGSTYKLDCDGNQCVCTVDGQAQPPFPQDTACNDPQNVLKLACGTP